MQISVGNIIKLDSRLIIKMYRLEYFVPIDEINKSFIGEGFRPDIKNLEKIDVGSFKISNDRKRFEIAIGGVTFYSDIDDVEKIINNQISEIKIFKIRNDPTPTMNYYNNIQTSFYNTKPPITQNIVKNPSYQGTAPLYIPIKPNLWGCNEDHIKLESSQNSQDPEISFYQKQKNVSPKSEVSAVKNDFFIEKVAGVTYENRQDTIKQMKEGDQVILQREPENAHDKNAIRVLTLSGIPVGYISRSKAENYAPIFDTINESVYGEVLAVNKGYDVNSNFGLTIRFRLNTQQPPRYMEEL